MKSIRIRSFSRPNAEKYGSEKLRNGHFSRSEYLSRDYILKEYHFKYNCLSKTRTVRRPKKIVRVIESSGFIEMGLKE